MRWLVLGVVVACAAPRRVGSLEKAVIRDVVRSHRGEVEACYESLAIADNTLGGGMKVKFVIAASGEVSEAVVASSSLESPQLEQCVLKAVRGWVFPKPKGDGEVPVTYPLSFGQAIDVER